MTAKELIQSALKSLQGKGVDLTTLDNHSLNLMLAREVARLNKDTGNSVPMSQVSEILRSDPTYKQISSNIGINKYTLEALNNEAKYQGYGLKPLVNAASDALTLGFGPRLEYGYNANDKYLDPSMIKTREVLTAVGENALQLAVPTGIAKGVSLGAKAVGSAVHAGNKANKAVQAIRKVHAATTKAVNKVKKYDKALSNSDKFLAKRYNRGKWIVNNLILDQNNFDIGKELATNGVGKTLLKKVTPVAINMGYGGYADAIMNGNQADFFNGRLTDDQWRSLGMTPEEGTSLVKKYGEDWHKHAPISKDDAEDMKWTGRVNSSTAKVRNTKTKQENKPWYHHEAVGYGTGALGGGATGYLLSTLLNADKAGRLLSTIGGGFAGSLLGRYIQQKMLKS